MDLEVVVRESQAIVTPNKDGVPLSSYQRMLSACGGAVLVALLVTPFDVIKTRMQHGITSPAANFNAGRLTENTINMLIGGTQRPVSGTMSAIMKISRYEGVPTLWRGLTPTLVLQGPSTVIYYLGYEKIRDYLQANGSIGGTAPIIAGSAARTLAAICISPLELIRTRMQASTVSYNAKQMLGEVVGMTKSSGVLSLWRGLVPTLWRDVPFSAIYWLSYESLMTEFKRKQMFSLNEFWGPFVAGAFAGTLAAVVTTPFDVAKTIQQVIRHDEPGSGQPAIKSVRMGKLMRSIVKEHGWSGLFRGLSPRIAKVAPSCAIMISTYEFGKRFFERPKTPYPHRHKQANFTQHSSTLTFTLHFKQGTH
ncbi:mitochondrial carrier domain-containing protein [Chytridium lagenaria]|nr:mitochondrial carrier domain-containing protein [Chytridium lagenaria]